MDSRPIDPRVITNIIRRHHPSFLSPALLLLNRQTAHAKVPAYDHSWEFQKAFLGAPLCAPFDFFFTRQEWTS